MKIDFPREDIPTHLVEQQYKTVIDMHIKLRENAY